MPDSLDPFMAAQSGASGDTRSIAQKYGAGGFSPNPFGAMAHGSFIPRDPFKEMDRQYGIRDPWREMDRKYDPFYDDDDPKWDPKPDPAPIVRRMRDLAPPPAPPPLVEEY